MEDCGKFLVLEMSRNAFPYVGFMWMCVGGTKIEQLINRWSCACLQLPMLTKQILSLPNHSGQGEDMTGDEVGKGKLQTGKLEKYMDLLVCGSKIQLQMAHRTRRPYYLLLFIIFQKSEPSHPAISLA